MSKYCFFCAESYPDKTKMYARGNYNCCPNCNNVMSKGITIIGYTDKPSFENQEPISKIVTENKELFAYPTNEWCTFSEDTTNKIFNTEIAQGVLNMNKRDGFVLMPDETFRQLKHIYKEIK